MKKLILIVLLLPMFTFGQMSSARKLLMMQTPECPTYIDNGGLQYTYYVTGDLTVNYPSTVNQGDDLILVVFSAEDYNTINAVSGWNTVEINTGDPADGYAVFYRSAEGNEDGGTITVDVANDGFGIFYGVVFRFSGANMITSRTSGSAFLTYISTSTPNVVFDSGRLGLHLWMFTGSGYANTLTWADNTTYTYEVSVSNSNEGGGKVLMHYGCAGTYKSGFQTSPLSGVRTASKTIELSN